MVQFTKKKYAFLSLKWKALLLFSLVLLSINASFPFFGHQGLMRHFAKRQQAAHAHFTVEFEGLLKQTTQRLQQFGGMISSLEGMSSALTDRKKNGSLSAFEDHWPLLQLDMGIDLVRFYDKSGKELGRFGPITRLSGEEALINQGLRDLNAQERPIAFLSCRKVCTQYVLAPVLTKGRNIGAILLGASLAEVIVNFQEISGVDVAVIIDEDLDARKKNVAGGVSAEISARQIPYWGKTIVASTNKSLTLPLLKVLAEAAPSLEEVLNGYKTRFLGKDYEVSLIPLQGLSGAGSGHLVLMNDISETLREIRSATKQSIIAGIVGLFLSEALLLLILWTPMSRLNKISEKLPLLAQGAFSRVRVGFKQSPPAWMGMDDEIDLLDKTAIALSYQLEKLEAKVKKRTKSLAHRMEELANEKDFIAHLLDTARVIILTQDRLGKVLMLNQYGRDLTGYSSNELSGEPFIKLLSSEHLDENLPLGLSALSDGNKEHLSHESILICKDRSTRNIVWFHSRLKRKGLDAPAILSVGLDFTERKQAELRLSWLADHDPLTGLFNRRRFQLELERTLAEAARYNRRGALLFFDLDQFKYVNDTRGHQAGDALLKEVSRQLSRLVRSTDIICRLGGDEFALVIAETDEQGATQVAQKILEVLNEVEVPALEQNYKVSASIGITIFPTQAKTVRELLSNADLAMYQAKERGRGDWHLFTGTEPIKERMKERLFWRNKVKKALELDDFVLHFQPVQEIGTKRISFYEALLRMRRKDGGLIAPGTFIPVAEQSGLIHLIDQMVLEKVIQHQADLAKKGLDITFSLNLSGYAFNNPGLLPHLKKILEKSGANPKAIIIEITETAAVSDLSAACKLMDDIKALGCRFALDDFGMGFSSFNYLKQLPVDFVKIGDSFIRELPLHPDDQIFVKSLSDVTQVLGKKTVAEGVENPEILKILRSYGVDYAQGYHIGRPKSALLEEMRSP